MIFIGFSIFLVSTVSAKLAVFLVCCVILTAFLGPLQFLAAVVIVGFVSLPAVLVLMFGRLLSNATAGEVLQWLLGSNFDYDEMRIVHVVDNNPFIVVAMVGTRLVIVPLSFKKVGVARFRWNLDRTVRFYGSEYEIVDVDVSRLPLLGIRMSIQAKHVKSDAIVRMGVRRMNWLLWSGMARRMIQKMRKTEE